MADVVLTEDDERPGELLAHYQLDCFLVQVHRAQERPIVTMLGTTKPLPSYLKQHRCEGANARRARAYREANKRWPLEFFKDPLP